MWPQPKNPQSNCMFYKKCPGQNAQNEINPVHLPSCAISRPKLLLSCYAPELFLKPKAINVFGERTNPQITQCALCRLDYVWLWNTILHCACYLGQGETRSPKPPRRTTEEVLVLSYCLCCIIGTLNIALPELILFHSKFKYILLVNTIDFFFKFLRQYQVFCDFQEIIKA